MHGVLSSLSTVNKWMQLAAQSIAPCLPDSDKKLHISWQSVIQSREAYNFNSLHSSSTMHCASAVERMRLKTYADEKCHLKITP